MAGRISQIVVEVHADGTPTGRVTQIVEEIAASGTPTGRVSQLVMEAGGFGTPLARVSQLVLEVLVLNRRIDMPLIYPTLPGLTFDVIWRPKAINATPQVHSSGREVRIGYAQYPLHEFELVYSLLRGRPGEIEFKTFLGFFLALQGSLNGFLFKNPDDFSVVGQAFATTDGINSQFGPLVRTFGASGMTGTEPVGYVDVTQPFNLYLDGALVDPNDPSLGYSVQTTQPVAQYVKFNNTPAAGHVLTVDMTYFYYCRFADDTMDFSKFMAGLWEVKQVKLASLRG